LVESQRLCSPFPPTCQLFPFINRLICQRAGKIIGRHCGSATARNPGRPPGTPGSRKRGHIGTFQRIRRADRREAGPTLNGHHKISGSVKSSGWAAP
jgi:hypothetical protein